MKSANSRVPVWKSDAEVGRHVKWCGRRKVTRKSFPEADADRDASLCFLFVTENYCKDEASTRRWFSLLSLLLRVLHEKFHTKVSLEFNREFGRYVQGTLI